MCAVFFFSRSVGEFDDSVFGSMANLQKSCAPRPADHRQETTGSGKLCATERVATWPLASGLRVVDFPSSSPALSFVVVYCGGFQCGCVISVYACSLTTHGRAFGGVTSKCACLTMWDVVCSLQQFQHPTPLALCEDFLGSSPCNPQPPRVRMRPSQGRHRRPRLRRRPFLQDLRRRLLHQPCRCHRFKDTCSLSRC